MFREYEAVYTPPAPKGSGKEILIITVLNGDTTQIPYYSSMSMVDLQKDIYSKLVIPPKKQKILFKDKEVQVLTCCLTKYYENYAPWGYDLQSYVMSYSLDKKKLIAS